MSNEIVPMPVENQIRTIRGQPVMLDADLAAVYGVMTGRLNEARSRNIERFPEDFAFQLTEIEAESLISQSATSNEGRGGTRKLPWAYTQHGCLMASNVLSTPEALQRSVDLVRAFIALRDRRAAPVLTPIEHAEKLFAMVETLRGLVLYRGQVDVAFEFRMRSIAAIAADALIGETATQQLALPPPQPKTVVRLLLEKGFNYPTEVNQVIGAEAAKLFRLRHPGAVIPTTLQTMASGRVIEPKAYFPEDYDLVDAAHKTVLLREKAKREEAAEDAIAKGKP